MRIAIMAAALAALPGCIAQTAVDVVTLPVRAVSGTVDLLTTSQSEADEKRGRRIRKEEARLAKERRKEEARFERERRKADREERRWRD